MVAKYYWFSVDSTGLPNKNFFILFLREIYCQGPETSRLFPKDGWTNEHNLVHFESTSGLLPVLLGTIGGHMRHHSYSLPKKLTCKKFAYGWRERKWLLKIPYATRLGSKKTENRVFPLYTCFVKMCMKFVWNYFKNWIVFGCLFTFQIKVNNQLRCRNFPRQLYLAFLAECHSELSKSLELSCISSWVIQEKVWVCSYGSKILLVFSWFYRVTKQKSYFWERERKTAYIFIVLRYTTIWQAVTQGDNSVSWYYNIGFWLILQGYQTKTLFSKEK